MNLLYMLRENLAAEQQEKLKAKQKEINAMREMTRDEAYDEMHKSQAGKKIGAYDIAPSVFCDYLEALGLIKFKEPCVRVIDIDVTDKGCVRIYRNGRLVHSDI